MASRSSGSRGATRWPPSPRAVSGAQSLVKLWYYNLRGYGDSDAPADPTAYSIFHIVGDMVALLDHLGLPKAFVVGHDWGALVAWHLSLFRPDLVRAVLNIGVSYFPRGPTPMTASTSCSSRCAYIIPFLSYVSLK
jgi:pimeloyl-ACP methyl ester carboxylesterase